MSKQYIAVIVTLLATVLPLLGINVGSEALTTTASTIAVVVSGFVVLLERYKKGGVSPLGFRK